MVGYLPRSWSNNEEKVQTNLVDIQQLERKDASSFQILKNWDTALHMNA